MPSSPPIPKDMLPLSTPEQIRAIKGSVLTATDRDTEWDKAFEARVALLPGCDRIVGELKNPAIADDRSKDDDIKKRYNALPSDVERIGTFGAGTRVEESAIPANKPRLKAVFLFLGPEFQAAYKRAKNGNEIKPVSLADRQTADRNVRFTSGK